LSTLDNINIEDTDEQYTQYIHPMSYEQYANETQTCSIPYTNEYAACLTSYIEAPTYSYLMQQTPTHLTHLTPDKFYADDAPTQTRLASYIAPNEDDAPTQTRLASYIAPDDADDAPTQTRLTSYIAPNEDDAPTQTRLTSYIAPNDADDALTQTRLAAPNDADDAPRLASYIAPNEDDAPTQTRLASYVC
jgi:hypothetical protein